MSKPDLWILDDYQIDRQTMGKSGVRPSPGTIRTVVVTPAGPFNKERKWKPTTHAWVLFLKEETRQYRTREEALAARVLHGLEETPEETLANTLKRIAAKRCIKN